MQSFEIAAPKNAVATEATLFQEKPNSKVSPMVAEECAEVTELPKKNTFILGLPRKEKT